MKNSATKRLLTILGSGLLILLAALLYYSYSTIESTEHKKGYEEGASRAVAQKMDRVEKKVARSEYFFKLMRDPATNQIPDNIRNRELQFAKTLPSAQQALQKAKAQNPSLQAVDYSWESAGPTDVGGRTRAIGVDQRNPDVVLAGAVSGGMWKSTDGGNTWQLRTPDLPNLSVTSVAQNPLNPDIWYYSSGEVIGNSANAVGAAYYGQGIYKSTDNGDTWNLMPQASSSTKGLVDVFNTVSRIRISPASGTIFIASTGFGIYRSTDGQSFSSSPVLGTAGEQLYTDVTVASDGTVGATISEASFDDQQSQDSSHPNHNPGIFVSTDDGQNWTDVTPDDFPTTYRRSVLTFAPSNPDILYVFTLKGANNTSNQGVAFFKIDVSDPQNPVAEDRSANLPDFRVDGNGSGYINTQNGYNMMVNVKPDNEDFVVLGATNLFRSTDGFATTPDGGYDGNSQEQKDEYWIGGYNTNNSFSSYPNQHPDQHIAVFPEPQNNPDIMWSGHDGGLSYSSDVTTSKVVWENRDQGYVTSQFYAADLPQGTDDGRLMGGTQDNGTPFFQRAPQGTQNSDDVSSGDGGYAYFTSNYQYVSSQLGRVLRWNNDFSQLAYITPSEAEGQLFIHPYVIDPNDENVMYYPENDHIWRNTRLNEIQSGNSPNGTTTGWNELEGISAGGQHTITALEVSRNPGNILYFGGYNSSLQPAMKRLDNAKTATTGVQDIPLPDNSSLTGAYIKDIAINPVNANEVMVVLSNYNIVGLYHTTDGGETWNAVEGNLTGSSQNPGPSLRSATMVPAESGTIYLVATSTGVYSTQLLEGDNTVWGQEASGSLGNAVTEHLASRVSDGNVIAATHGRGIFYGTFGGSTNAPFIVAEPLKGQPGSTITLRANDFQFNTTPSENTVTFGDVEATVVSASTSELEVEIPRGVIGRQAPNSTVTITVTTNNESLSTTFEILPPNDFTVQQNYPNPFNPTTTIPFDLSYDANVTLTIYNMNGQKVRQPLQEAPFNAGTYNQQVDMTGLASGIYIYRIYVQSQGSGDAAMQSKKMTFIK